MPNAGAWVSIPFKRLSTLGHCQAQTAQPCACVSVRPPQCTDDYMRAIVSLYYLPGGISARGQADFLDRQKALVESLLSNSTALVKVVVGHHPVSGDGSLVWGLVRQVLNGMIPSLP